MKPHSEYQVFWPEIELTNTRLRNSNIIHLNVLISFSGCWNDVRRHEAQAAASQIVPFIKYY
jgi:hypothetical protein